MTLSPSSSFLDLTATNGLSSHRIPRKPPPVIDQSERYPSPDPLDPFAPLWVLRNRTSSALPGTHSIIPPCSGPYGSQETLSILGDRRYSSSYSYSSPTSSATIQSRPGSNYTTYNMLSPGSPLKAVTPRPQLPKDKAPLRTGHYTPYSQMNQKDGNPVGTLQAFPRIATPCQSRTDIDLASPKSKRPWPVRNDTLERLSQFRDEGGANDRDDNGSSGTDSDEEDAYIKSSLKLKSPILIRRHTPQLNPQAQAQAKPKGNPTHQRAQSVRTSATQKLSPQNRLAKFLFPRKISFLRNNGIGNLPIVEGPAGRRPSTAESRPVSKSSISAPQAMVSTVTWDSSRNKSRRGRASTTPITRADEMKCTKSVDMYNDDDPQLSQKCREMQDIEETRPTINSDCDNSSPAHLRRVLDPLIINQLTDKLDSDDHHLVSGEKKRHSANIDSGSTAAKRRNTTTVFQALNVGSPRTVTENASGQHDRTNSGLVSEKPEMSPMPPLSPVEPSMSSASNMSNVNISVSEPSFATNPSQDDHRYTSPRPAPHPPMSIKPLFIAKKKSKVATEDDKPWYDYTTGDGCAHACATTIPTVPAPSSTKPKCKIPPPSGVFAFPTEWTLPTPPQITFAASLPLTCEDGTHVSFGSLFAATRTIVVFIRHFWCPLCQDYMTSLKSLVRPEMLAEWPAGSSEDAENIRARLVKFVVISNGAPGMIHKYRQIFGLPFKMYTDPALAVYNALGMGKDGDDCRQMHQSHSFYQYQQHQLGQKQSLVGPGPSIGVSDHVDRKAEDKCDSGVRGKSGGYVKHGLMGGIAMVVVRAIKVRMPVWEKGGNVGQLGGEFIFGPGLTCSFAHRMQTTKGHAPIEDVLTAAGIDVSRLSHGDERPFESIIVGSNADSTVLSNAVLPTSPSLAPLRPLQRRRRMSSLKALTGTLALSRAASVASALSVGLTRKGSINVGTMNSEGLRTKRQTRRYSMGVGMGVDFGSVGGGMMSREEEERWMEQRQQSIERLREKKNMRRAIGMAVSAQGYSADVSVTTSEASSVVEGETEQQQKEGKGKEEARSNRGMHWDTCNELEDMEVIGKMDEDLGLDSDSDAEREASDTARIVMVGDARRSMDSFSDSASSWSRSTAPPPEGGSYVFFHDVVL